MADVARLAAGIWRDTRDPVVGDVIAGLDVHFSRSPGGAGDFVGPALRASVPFHADWLQVARSGDPASVGWLARTLTQRLPERPALWGRMGDKHLALAERLAVIDSLPPDPRFADALCEILERASFDIGLIPEPDAVYGPVFASLQRQADPRTTPRLTELKARPRARVAGIRAWIADACARWLAAPPTFTPVPDPAVWQGMRPAAEVAAVPAALVDAVRTAPADPTARHVLADALTEVGDPRGEFVALQLAGDPDSLARAARLFRAHKDTWLGPDLASVLVNVQFHAGFLHSAELGHNARATPEAWSRAARDPVLNTLAWLFRGRGNLEHYGAFVGSPATTGLVGVEVERPSLLDRLAGAPHPNLRHLIFPRVPARGVLTQVRDTFPQVDGLSVDVRKTAGEVWSALDKAGLLGRLTWLRLRPDRALVPAVDVFGPAAARPHLTRVALGEREQRLEICRTDAGVIGLAVGWYAQRALELVPFLPPGSHLRLDPGTTMSPEQQAVFRAAVAERAPGIQVELGPTSWDRPTR